MVKEIDTLRIVRIVIVHTVAAEHQGSDPKPSFIALAKGVSVQWPPLFFFSMTFRKSKYLENGSF
jgi:hypothetical protein